MLRYLTETDMSPPKLKTSTELWGLHAKQHRAITLGCLLVPAFTVFRTLSLQL